MKIVAILGSPRRDGASSRIAEAFMDRARKFGCETSTYFLNEMQFKGCQACHACKGRSEVCVLDDDLSTALSALVEADVAVFATPVHFGDASGQFKSFFDRTWSLVKPDFLTNPDPCRLTAGKRALLIVSQGDISDKHRDVVKKYKNFLNLYGYVVNVIRAVDCGISVDVNVDEQIRDAQELAVQMSH